ncbi:hypothetical protein CTEN210_12639 [Chaetoceros tenuissimus]|uniref:Uncharacterized protein n=1 Tax=Chaetoceros tenuissimus TaxID=426638 RepID=A0AAD3HAP3_9STRA|nr:hypothetical protein CTEN210_12639 [Chaetoceros tenuissimus]
MRSSTFRLLALLCIIVITCTSYTYISILQSKLLPESLGADQQEILEYTSENDEQKISKNAGVDTETSVYTDDQPLQLSKEETETKVTQDMSDDDMPVAEKNKTKHMIMHKKRIDNNNNDDDDQIMVGNVTRNITKNKILQKEILDNNNDDDDQIMDANFTDYEIDNITMSIQICESDQVQKNMTNLDPITMLETTYASTKSLKAIFKMLKNITSDRPDEYHGQHITSDMKPIEIARCKRYGYEYNSTLQNKRKRVFLGALVGDDSWHSIGAHAIEMYGLYQTVALVEGNNTFTKHDRCKRFQPGSIHYEGVKKSGIFGPNTTVKTALYYAKESDTMSPMTREQLQRDVFTKIWIQQGMTEDDIGVVADMDEFFTRDFMLAMQTCQIPQFQKGQSCKAPKVVASTLTFEAAPDCIYKTKRWFHPDAIIGECIDGIGNETLHKPTLRKSFSGGRETFREDGYGIKLKDYDNETKQDLIRFPPLWKPVDFRSVQGGGPIGEILNGDNPKRPMGYVGYHFHNFFDSIKPIRKKYATYGHPNANATFWPLGNISTELDVAVRCIMNRTFEGIKPREYMFSGGIYEALQKGNNIHRIPIMFQRSFGSYRNDRFNELRNIIEEDELKFGRKQV